MEKPVDVAGKNIVLLKPTSELLLTASPFLFVDRVLNFHEDTLVGLKVVTQNEKFLTGHFPGNPIVPGVLLIEMAVQATALLMIAKNEGKTFQEGYLVRTKDFAFYNPARPGDEIRIQVTFKEQTGNYVTAKARLTEGSTSKKLAKGEVILYLR